MTDVENEAECTCCKGERYVLRELVRNRELDEIEVPCPECNTESTFTDDD